MIFFTIYEHPSEAGINRSVYFEAHRLHFVKCRSSEKNPYHFSFFELQHPLPAFFAVLAEASDCQDFGQERRQLLQSKLRQAYGYLEERGISEQENQCKSSNLKADKRHSLDVDVKRPFITLRICAVTRDIGRHAVSFLGGIFNSAY